VKPSHAFSYSPRIYVIYGDRSFPSLLDLVHDEEGDATGLVTKLWGVKNGYLGAITAAGVGDLNGDGYSDFLFGASGRCCGPTVSVAGRTWICYGGQGRPREIELANPPPGRTVLIVPKDVGTLFGARLAPAGDLNLDGVPDFLIGAERKDREGMLYAGEAYAIFGRRDLQPDVEMHLENGFEGIRMMGEDPPPAI
jgi:hypothetical protein